MTHLEKNLETVINQELIVINHEHLRPKLVINLNKSNYIIFRPYHKRVGYKPSIKLFNYSANRMTEIECKEFVKYLRIIIDNNKHKSLSFRKGQCG